MKWLFARVKKNNTFISRKVPNWAHSNIKILENEEEKLWGLATFELSPPQYFKILIFVSIKE